MKICLVAEGSYPYVTGGVSSWIQTLVSQMPEHEFIILAVGAKKEDRGKFKYTLPANIVEVREVFLDSYRMEDLEWGQKFDMTERQMDATGSLMVHSTTTQWQDIFTFIQDNKSRNIANLLTSKDLFDLIQKACEEEYNQIPFTDFYWTVRSMLLPMYLLLSEDIPEADLYHSVSTGYAGMLASFAKWKYNKPFILTEHGIYTREREEEIIKADWVSGHFKDLWIQYFYKLSHCAYEFADEVVSLFHKNKEIQMEIGCPPEKIRIIPNGVDTSDFIQAEVERKSSTTYIGAVVRLVPIKDIITMIQSFSIVKREISDVQFVIMGPTEEDEEYFEECVSLVKALQLEEHVTFTGTVQVREYIPQMDILVLSSISEGQPLAVLEGMASKRPFVTTDVGSCRELLYGTDDGIGPAGVVVPVMHYMEMGKALIELARNEEGRRTMGQNGYERVSTFYTRQQLIEQYQLIYQSMREKAWQE